MAEVKRKMSKAMPEERLEWSKKMDFLLSIIGFAVDLANVWRFPYLCYKNGGGVFLIPYTIMLAFGALPLFFLELAMGQSTKSGPIALWTKLCPMLKGVGFCCVLVSWYVSFYYNVIIGWTIYFIIMTLYHSTSGLLPWQHCSNPWNTNSCLPLTQQFRSSVTYYDSDYRESNEIPTSSHGNRQDNLNQVNPLNHVDYNRVTQQTILNPEQEDPKTRTWPAQEYFERRLLEIDQSEGFHALGSLRPEIVGCVIIVFIILYFSLWKGVKSSGKVVWVTATAPYIILTILLLRGIFLPGAATGILYYIWPRVEKLLESSVWIDAAVQVFYSTGVGFGVHLTYASFNKFNNNCYRDALTTAAVNSFTSFYSGFVVFTYLGYLAEQMNKPVDSVASEGYGLVFQVYPQALATLPFAPFWSLLFFFMLLTLGLDSAMGGLEAVITGLSDHLKFVQRNFSREQFTGIIIFCSFLGSLINCTQGGAFSMVWFDTYSAGISLLFSAMLEAVGVAYFYGLDKFCDDVQSMIGSRPNCYWLICWKYVSPIFLVCVIALSVIKMERLTYHDYVFPVWATVLGWGLTLSSMSAVPIYALYYKSREYCDGLCGSSVRAGGHGEGAEDGSSQDDAAYTNENQHFRDQDIESTPVSIQRPTNISMVAQTGINEIKVNSGRNYDRNSSSAPVYV